MDANVGSVSTYSSKLFLDSILIYDFKIITWSKSLTSEHS